MQEDRRVRKTKAAIKHAFINLLKIKALDNITIQDITSQADINRGTFYLHYEDKYILLSNMEDEYTLALSSAVDFDKVIMQNDDLEAFAKHFTEDILKKVVTYLYDHIDFYKVIFSLERKSQIENKISDIMLNNMKKHVSKNNTIADIPLDYFHSYTAGAMISLIKHWVQDEQRMDPDTLVEHIFKIIFNGPLRLLVRPHNE
ncbi:TetR/AcrR family transcriptional regulator [Staphylococcus succinus]|uniref:TetR family transcriptional regulator n=2 Tax=Staphylococcus succinus TaxID=61015 RepID=A0A9Q6HQ70_9STAP|nr:TetR/AcrR family transcriptional regulator [Staphylococcus succinus]MEB8127153.1 TetR/AcrR family transcriptional regulator [Staphylococcus succinus]PTI42307.1 TetR family transcriptional regulator [Staphylococcus succinus]PTI76029.1 TetR family transcriptional regulator [Staphylococcus succinus]PTJ21133.1 TetR family transcriptional regulator [Staphylococcus succinus]RIN33475.1 TetR family transcriptional regulator [Staphylococcus succinus]